ncbi:NAD(P)-binding domain-containing protein [Staphylococcus kloosii]|jgi:predicted dinucleotide-binding enzyme|nr:NAD(P)-binding domain-containing protein [Staphylococcus kloosii]MBF7025314.1 NAD(P)-binding domain-containing protein [Staphylococcus kloosii]
MNNKLKQLSERDDLMKFGIIGVGNIGTILSVKLYEAGHQVKVADARSIEHLEGKSYSGKAVEITEVIKDIDILIISIPIAAIPNIKPIIQKVDDSVPIIDTSNYYPARDNKITAIENGMTESVWVSKQLDRDIVKAFNNLLAYTLKHKRKSEKTPGRVAATIAGNSETQKDTVKNIINQLGFDYVDTGNLENSWRQQPGTPAYCTELTEEELKLALEQADKDKAPKRRDKILELAILNKDKTLSHEERIDLNRKIYNS